MSDLNFILLANYNRITNENMNSIMKKISEDQWNKIFNGYYKSIRELCLHIFICDLNILNKIKTMHHLNVSNDKIINQKFEYLEKKFNSINEYIAMRKELDDFIIKLVNDIYDLDNVKLERKIEPPLMDMFNHETFHRGMISSYLEMLDIRNRIFRNVRSRK